MGIGWSFEKFVKPTSSNWDATGEWLSLPRKEAASTYDIFLTVSLNLNSTTIVMDHEAEQGENKYLSQILLPGLQPALLIIPQR